jgi:hypothetical protein
MTSKSEIIQGHFEVFNASKPNHPMQALVETLNRASQGRHNSIAIAHREAVQCLSRLYVPYLSATPSPEDFEAMADFAVKWAQLGDRVLKAIGEEAKANSTSNLAMSLFEGQFVGAIEGNATFELEKCAEELRAEWDEFGGYDPDYEYEESRA